MNRDFSLIDASLARIREGLRVLEDVARFVLKNEAAMNKLKEMRHRIIKIEALFGVAQVLAGRRGGDIGAAADTQGSIVGHISTAAIVRANANRASEALRSLVELARCYAPAAVIHCDEIRYRLYLLEYELLVGLPQFWLQKYFAEGIVYPLSADVEELLLYVRRGARIVQLRDKVSDKREIYQKAKLLCQKIFDYQKKSSAGRRVLLIVNDHVDIAASLPVAGVHLGQGDGGIAAARRKIGGYKIIGYSTHSLAQAAAAQKDGADYIGVGPVFATPTKETYPPIGLDNLESVAEQISIPLVAIGGITPGNVATIHGTGVKNVAVVRSARDFFGVPSSV